MISGLTRMAGSVSPAGGGGAGAALPFFQPPRPSSGASAYLSRGRGAAALGEGARALAMPPTLSHHLLPVARAADAYAALTRWLAAAKPRAVLSFHNSAASLDAARRPMKAKDLLAFARGRSRVLLGDRAGDLPGAEEAWSRLGTRVQPLLDNGALVMDVLAADPEEARAIAQLLTARKLRRREGGGGGGGEAEEAQQELQPQQLQQPPQQQLPQQKLLLQQTPQQQNEAPPTQTQAAAGKAAAAAGLAGAAGLRQRAAGGNKAAGI